MNDAGFKCFEIDFFLIRFLSNNFYKQIPFLRDYSCHDGTIWYSARLEILFPQGFPGSNPGRGVFSFSNLCKFSDTGFEHAQKSEIFGTAFASLSGIRVVAFFLLRQ